MKQQPAGLSVEGYFSWIIIIGIHVWNGPFFSTSFVSWTHECQESGLSKVQKFTLKNKISGIFSLTEFCTSIFSSELRCESGVNLTQFQWIGRITADKQTIHLIWICPSSDSIPCGSLERKGDLWGFVDDVVVVGIFFKQTVIDRVLPTEIQLIHMPCPKQYIYEAPSFRAFWVWTLPSHPSHWVLIQCACLCHWVVICEYCYAVHTACCLEVVLRIVLMTYIGRQHLIPDF